jgi:ABC-type sulfate/molybdate transport systems ATPase subunit
VLFLDEPFGALDALTRDALQQELARLCSSAERPVTTVMITNSVEEAILLADRIVPMTRGPRATLLSPIRVDLPRPRSAALLNRDAHAAHVRAAMVSALTGAVTASSNSPAEAGGHVHRVGPATAFAEASASLAEARSEDRSERRWKAGPHVRTSSPHPPVPSRQSPAPLEADL